MQLDADGDGDGPCVGADVPLWPADGVAVGVSPEPPVGVLDAPPPVALAGALLLGCADGLVDGDLPDDVADGLVAPAVTPLPGPAEPPAGADVPGVPNVGTWPTVEPPFVVVPVGDWFPADVPNAVKASNTTPALTRATTAPTISAHGRFRSSSGG